MWGWSCSRRMFWYIVWGNIYGVCLCYVLLLFEMMLQFGCCGVLRWGWSCSGWMFWKILCEGMNVVCLCYGLFVNISVFCWDWDDIMMLWCIMNVFSNLCCCDVLCGCTVYSNNWLFWMIVCWVMYVMTRNTVSLYPTDLFCRSVVKSAAWVYFLMWTPSC